MEGSGDGDESSPFLLDYVLDTLFLVVLGELRAGHGDVLGHILGLRRHFLSSPMPQTGDPEHHTHTHTHFRDTVTQKCAGDTDSPNSVSYLFLNGSIIKCLSRPKIPKEIKPYGEKTQQATCNFDCKTKSSSFSTHPIALWEMHLPVVDHGTEELQLQIEPSWNAVEEPPQAAGEVLETRRRRGEKEGG